MKKENEGTWKNLYDGHINADFNDNWDNYYKTKLKLKHNFIKFVEKYATDKPILECGCGTAKTTIYFSRKGYKSYGMDLEEEMVNFATENAEKQCNSDNMPVIVQGDCKEIPYDDKFFSVTHSSGVMEHYSDEDIVSLINEQLRVSDYCVFSVPTSYFEKKMLGNERFLTRKEWRKIISKSNGKIIKESGYHYKKLADRIKDILKKPKRLFKPIALYVFVLEEK